MKREQAVYVISVAADLAGVHPQTLRIYERKGLLTPQRTSGNTRRYSGADIERLHRISELTEQGINLAGVKMILDLEEQLARARAQLARVAKQIDRLESIVSSQMQREPVEIMPAAVFNAIRSLWGTPK